MGKHRKTRKEKIIAELRRKLKSRKDTPPTAARQYPVQTEATQASSVVSQDYSYIGKDLRKTGVLTGLAILLQSVLYFLLEK